MKATPLSPAEIFGNQIRYVVPLFQRPYVWNETDQWAPLWEDVARVAETVLDTPNPAYGPKVVPPHFLGAVVVDQQHTGVNYISVRGIVDGQQRMTTLQLLMDAAQAVVARHGDPQDAQALQVLILNHTPQTSGGEERFKVWPTDRDQAAFRAAMDDLATVPPPLAESRIAKAHAFFTEQVQTWADVTGDPDKCRARLTALTQTLHHFLKVVVIDLEPGDNAQVIFETLNHRGTPLLAADLIKNLVFQSAQAQGLDIEQLYKQSWATLDTDYWRQDVAQGRLYRPRIDVFMQYWLTMRRLREVATDRVFVEFRDYLNTPEAPALATVVNELVADAEVFAGLDKHSASSVVGQFHYRVLKALDSFAVTPFLLWLLRWPVEQCPAEQQHQALRAMESWLVRRALCRYQAKGVNQVVVDLLRRLDKAGPGTAGQVTEDFLSEQTAAARAWPTDNELIQSLTTQPVYKNLSRPRLRMLLEALEDDLRASNGGLTEPERCPRNLTVEHLLPQAWQTHWPLPDHLVEDPLAGMRRDSALQTLGNLTLVTVALNPSMSNGPWTDEAAQAAGLPKGKRSALGNSVLLLNADLTMRPAIDEDVIAERGVSLAQRATRIWHRPTASDLAAEQAAPSSGAPTDPIPTEDTVGSGSDQAENDLPSPVLMSPAPGTGQEPGIATRESSPTTNDIVTLNHNGKYAPLHSWLLGQDPHQTQLRVTFSQLEDVLGFALPDSCRNHMAHWYGYEGSAVARALADAGWKASQVNLTAETAVLVRTSQVVPVMTSDSAEPPLSTAESGEQAQASTEGDSGSPSASGAQRLRYGRTQEEWDRLEDECYAFLVETARSGAYSSYTQVSDELAQRTGFRRFDFSDPGDRSAMGHLLARVAERDLPATGLLLTAIVLYLNGNDAGGGFYTLAAAKGLLTPKASADERLRFWLDQVKGVHAHYC